MKSCFPSLLTVVLVLIGISIGSAHESFTTEPGVILTPPSNSTATETAILLHAGDPDIPIESYFGLLRSIQNTSSYNLWVAIPYYGKKEFLSNEVCEFTPILKILREVLLIDTDNVFISGHGKGGFVLQNHVTEHAPNTTGAIMMGSYPLSNIITHPEYRFPVPVLIIGGELDGIASITRMTRTFSEMLNAPNATNYYNYSVCLLRGVNHTTYLSGIMPPTILEQDLNSEVDYDLAVSAVTNVTNAFIAIHSNSTHKESSIEILKDYVYNMTLPLVTPILQSLRLEGSVLLGSKVANSTPWLEQLADYVAQIDPIKYTMIADDDSGTSFYDFVFNDPKVDVLSRTHVRESIYSYKKYAECLEADTPSCPQSAEYISVKFKNAEAVWKAFDIPGKPLEINCSHLNQLATNTIFYSLPYPTRLRYLKYGLVLQFMNDELFDSSFKWLISEPKLKEEADSYSITAPLYKTGSNVKDSLSDLFYCKLISPARVAEWIYTDGLRRNYSAGTKTKTAKE